MAKRRVRKRVLAGGHDIPPEVIERRFFRSLYNLMNRYRAVVDRWLVYDNSLEAAPMLIAGGGGAETVILKERKWLRLQRLSAKLQN